ncbi:hypothetical protein R1sor_003797 [Riccia sorocarpa]|uniref:Zinc finger PHD-type domain-containing protein n=1 Tax=Riccia sorocarpa TaxID=122646 RepID=A0ABD3H639_9MARC
MARVHGVAYSFWETLNWREGDHPEWKLIFNNGNGKWERKLRFGGYYAGHLTKDALKLALHQQHIKQERASAALLPGYCRDDLYRPPEATARDSSDRKPHVEPMESQKRRKTVASPDTSPGFRETAPDSPSLPRKHERHAVASPPTYQSSGSRNKSFNSSLTSDEDRTRKILGQIKGAENVADMYVLKCGNSLVPITNLPLCIGGMASGGSGDQDIYLTAKFGDRMKTFPVDMWKLLLSSWSEPCLMVKTTRNSWVRLVNPLPGYSKTVGDGYVLAYFLDFLKKSPSASVAAMEGHLAKHCSMYGHGPFLERLSKHLWVIRSFVEEDDDLKKASGDSVDLRGDLSRKKRQVVRSVLGLGECTEDKVDEKAEEREMDYRKQNQQLVVHSFAEESSAEEWAPQGTPKKRARESKKQPRKSTEPAPKRNSNYKAKSFGRLSLKGKKLDDPPICALCDDGGDLLICDGPCSRYFHAFPGTGKESFCKTLGLSRKETKVERWYCKNCEYKQHQCFICGQLGSMDTPLGRPEVYMCVVPSCKRFYHAHCLAELVDLPNFRNKEIAYRTGTESLVCPRHKCDTCRVTELTPGSLVQCRRCPKAWHRSCFTNFISSGERPSTIIWNHDTQEFVYCKEHKVCPSLQTPSRDHIRFPEVVEETKVKKSRFKSGGSGGRNVGSESYALPPSVPSLAADMGLLDY